MLHLTKLCVGIRDVAQLQQVQAARLAAGEPLRHCTRNFPRRAAEIIDGGSLYWVIAGSMLVRQRVLDIVEAAWDDGSACAALMLDATLVPLSGRPTKAFQGWRYLSPDAAPPDLTGMADARGAADLPPALRQALRDLCLL